MPTYEILDGKGEVVAIQTMDDSFAPVLMGDQSFRLKAPPKTKAKAKPQEADDAKTDDVVEIEKDATMELQFPQKEPDDGAD